MMQISVLGRGDIVWQWHVGEPPPDWKALTRELPESGVLVFTAKGDELAWVIRQFEQAERDQIRGTSRPTRQTTVGLTLARLQELRAKLQKKTPDSDVSLLELIDILIDGESR